MMMYLNIKLNYRFFFTKDFLNDILIILNWILKSCKFVKAVILNVFQSSK